MGIICKDGFLFNTRYFSEISGEWLLQVKEEINHFGDDYILSVDEHELFQAIYNKFKFDELIKLKTNKIEQNEPRYIESDHPNKIPVFLFQISIPFEGNAELFKYTPTTCLSVRPRGKIIGSEISVSYAVPSSILSKTNSEIEIKQSLEKEIEQNIKLLKEYVEWINKDAENFNRNLENTIKEEINRRKQNMQKVKFISQNLNIPIRKRNDAERFLIPVKKKHIELPSPKEMKEQYPVISEKAYEDILDVIKNAAIAIERSPSVFNKLKEEEIRDIILVFLNAVFEGKAMGEVFNCSGKTDILIRHENMNLFIGECKFWRGKETFLETIHQILRYATWRDTKLAIIIFNRNKDLSKILDEIPYIIREHPNFKLDLGKKGETDFRFKFTLNQDKGKEVLLTVLVFNIALP